MESSNLIMITQNKLEERDNILRESSIAEDHWKQVIDKIKQHETKMTEEQNAKVNSSVFDSIQDKICNKTIIIVKTLISLHFYRHKSYNNITK